MSSNTIKAARFLGWAGGTIHQVSYETGLTVYEILNSSDIEHDIRERAGVKLPPRYIHDCESCTYLGQYGEFDLYYCQAYHPTLICRDGNGEADYKSGIEFALVPNPSPEFVEALKRARTQRFWVKDRAMA